MHGAEYGAGSTDFLYKYNNDLGKGKKMQPAKAFAHDSAFFATGLSGNLGPGWNDHYKAMRSNFATQHGILVHKQTNPYYKMLLSQHDLDDCPFRDYTGGSMGFNRWLATGEINPKLSNPERHAEHYKQKAGLIHAAFDSTNPLPISTVAYSGLRKGAAEYVQAHKKGDLVTFPAVSSCTIDHDKPFSFFAEKLPHGDTVGYHAAAFHLDAGLEKQTFYVGPYSIHKKESELMLRPGTKATYQGVETIDNGKVNYNFHHFKVHPYEANS